MSRSRLREFSVPASSIDRSARLYIAGHRGLVGSAVWREAERQGFTNLVGRPFSELDLRDRDATRRFFADVRPEVVILAAARVGGILANSTFPAEFLSDNLRVQVNVLDGRARFDVGLHTLNSVDRVDVGHIERLGPNRLQVAGLQL